MKLLPLWLAVWLGWFKAKPFRRKEVRLSRLWPLVAAMLSAEVAIALWIMGAIAPLLPAG